MRSAEPASSQGRCSAIAFSTLLRGLAGGDPLLVGVEARDPRVPAVGQLALLHRVDLGGEAGVALGELGELRLPGGVELGAAPADPLGEVLADAVGDEELGVLGPLVGALGLAHLLLAERLAVGGGGVLLVGRAVADVAVDDDQRRARLLGLELVEGGGDPLRVVGVFDVEDVPAVALEAQRHVVAVGEVGLAVDRDVVVVVDPAEVVELQVPGERAGFAGDALHQAAVAGDRVDVEVEELLAVAGAQPLRGDRHPDRGGDALAERPGRRLDPGGPAVLGVPRRAGVELAEAFDVLEADRGVADHLVVGVDGADPGEVEDRVEQHRGVARGEDEAIAVGPDRVGGVEAEVALPERVGERGQRHRGSGVPGVRLLDRVDRECADRVDAELVDVLGHDLRRS